MKRTDIIYKCTLGLYCLFVFFALYCVVLAMSTIFDPDIKKAEKEAREKIATSWSFRRGDILSADGKPLAPYYPEYTLYADFGVRIGKNHTVDKNKVSGEKKGKNSVKLDTFRIHIYEEFAKSLAQTVGGNVASYYKTLYNYRAKAEEAKKKANTDIQTWYTEDVLKYKIGVFQRDAILNNPHLLKRGRNVTGIYTRETGSRMYPFGRNFAHSAIGSVVDSAVSGIESMYDEELADGNNILTTIDTRIQDVCETVLQNGIAEGHKLAGGTIIVMEVATGDIKAMANLGAYNKAEYGVYDIFNNATRATIEPGSTFKTVSLMLALETGNVKLSDKFNTYVWRGIKFPNESALDTFMTVSRIIEKSVNVGTGNMVDKAFNRNVNKFIEAIKALKILDGIENMDEILPSIIQNSSRETMLKLSHGYQVKLAPIHLLSFYNAIANDGVMVRPRLVNGVVRRMTGETEMFEPEIINKSICSKSTLDSVRLALSRVVGRGSAQRIAGRPYGIVGKTGTSKIWLEEFKSYETVKGSRELASFCGYFPQKKPKYSCIVTLYTEYLNSEDMKKFSASSTAVPLFGKVADKIYALYFDQKFAPVNNAPKNIPVIKNTRGKNLSIISQELGLRIPDSENVWVKVDTVNKQLKISGISLKNGVVPDVAGMGLRDAVFLLENRGLKVSYSGLGKVVKQSPEQGTQYNSGQKIHLTLENK